MRFELMNSSFADYPLKPLGYSVMWELSESNTLRLSQQIYSLPCYHLQNKLPKLSG